MEMREIILRAAIRTYGEAGYRGSTTRRIAEAAGVNEVTLFRHFGSKQALLAEALDRMARDAVVPQLPQPPVDPPTELGAWCAAHITSIHEARSLLRTALGEHERDPSARRLAGDPATRAAGELTAYLERLRDAGLCAPDVDVPAATALLMGALFADAISRDVMPARYPYSLEHAAERYAQLLLRAIAPRPNSPTVEPAGDSNPDCRHPPQERHDDRPS